MDTLLYILIRTLVAGLQLLPLRWVARFGRAGGALAFHLDARHRRVTINNLTAAFAAEKSPAEIRALAQEVFRRLGENYCCAIKTAGMTAEELRPHLEFINCEPIRTLCLQPAPRPVIAAIGHFGNFELYARFGQFLPPVRTATTYRGLNQPALDRLMQSLRLRSGCSYFERRREADALKSAMSRPPILLGLLADQHAGRSGVWLPFFGRDCATSAAPAVLALRYQAALFPMICYRVGLARWRIETGSEIPTHEAGTPRSVAAIMTDVNRALEAGVRRDPANWFWVHNRWKPQTARQELQVRRQALEREVPE